MRSKLPTPASLILIVCAACGGSSPSGPSDSPNPKLLEGRVVNAIDGAAGAGLNVQVGSGLARNATTDANGYFRFDITGPANYPVNIRGTSIVDRDTNVDGPTAEPARISLIPTTFDLEAFDEMFRSSARLQRWTERPSLVLLGTIMVYRAGSERYAATAEQMSDEEVSQLLGHLEEGLAILTGNTFTSFASVDIERPAAGEVVPVQRTGKIVIGRYQGVTQFGNIVGYGQWADTPSGQIVGGAVFLDSEFDKTDDRRRLLRIHELGHALGYTHVTKRASVMNPTLGPEVTDFDRAGASVAFQRPPGNHSPDVDPAGMRISGSADGRGSVRWSPPVPCGPRGR